jgi:hypothetical protein
MKDDAMAKHARDPIDYQLLRSREIELGDFTAVPERVPNSTLDLFKVLHHPGFPTASRAQEKVS